MTKDETDVRATKSFFDAVTVHYSRTAIVRNMRVVRYASTIRMTALPGWTKQFPHKAVVGDLKRAVELYAAQNDEIAEEEESDEEEESGDEYDVEDSFIASESEDESDEEYP